MAYTYGTTTYAKDSNGNYITNGGKYVYQVRLGYQVNSQDVALNKSNISLRLEVRSVDSNYKTYGYDQQTTIDDTFLGAHSFDFRSTNVWQVFGTKTFDVSHDAEGKYSATKSGYFGTNAYGTGRPNSGSASVKVVLPTIARASSIAVSDANIGASTNITINKANSSFTTTLEYSTDNSNWTEIVSKTENQVYGWTVPTSFYALIPNSQTLTCYFRATTYSGDTNIGTTTTTATFTATGNPTINSATATDTNSTTTSLTGDNTKMVKYVSNVQVSVSASGQNSATITAISVNGTNLTLSGTSPKTGSITFNATSTNVYTVVATDSRGYTTTQTLTMDYVDYIPLTINATIKRNQPTDGNVNITFNGNYYSGDFATGTSNTLAVEYRYQEAGGSWSNWISITNDTTISGNTYSGTKQVSNIDYTKVYYFDIRAVDEVQAKTITNITVPKGVPIFNWDNDEVDMNVLLKYGEAGREDYDTAGFTYNRHGNMQHKRNTTGDNWNICKYDGNTTFQFYPELGNLQIWGDFWSKRTFTYSLDGMGGISGRYYKLANIPADRDGENAMSVNIRGIIGNWTTYKGIIDVLVSNRSGLNVWGTLNGTKDVFDNQRIVVYQESDNSHTIYLYCIGDFEGPSTLQISWGGTSSALPTIYTDYSFTTSPSGTLKWTSSEYNVAVLNTFTGSSVVSRSSGASLNSSEYRRFGNVVQLVLECNTTASTNTGSNCFAGTINNSALIPKTISAGMSYSASSGLIGSIDTSGNIVVRVVGANLATNRPFTISFTYVV